MRNPLPDDQKRIICTLAHETFVALKSAWTNPILACATAHTVPCIFILFSIPLDAPSQFDSGGNPGSSLGVVQVRVFGLATRRRRTMSATDTTSLAHGSALLGKACGIRRVDRLYLRDRQPKSKALVLTVFKKLGNSSTAWISAFTKARIRLHSLSSVLILRLVSSS